MIGAIKRRWKSSKKCSDKDKSEKVTPLQQLLPGGLPCGGGGGVVVATTPSSTSGGIGNRLRKGPPLPPVDFIHVNSGRIELHPGAATDKEKEQPCLRWGQLLQYEARHSWCGPQQMGLPPDTKHQPNIKKVVNKEVQLSKNHPHPHPHCQQEVIILQRLAELEKVGKGVPNLEGIVSALKEELTASVGRQERLVGDLESLHARVSTLESHNKALANIILPTLIRLTKENNKSTSSPIVASSNSLKKEKVATSPIKIAKLTQNADNNNSAGKMRQSQPPSRIMLPGNKSAASTPTPKSVPNNKKTVVATKPSKLPGTSSSSSGSESTRITATTPPPASKLPSSSCRIPSYTRPTPTTNTATTHPPKTTPLSKSKSQYNKPSNNNKSKLPVRKSSSSSGPTTPTPSAQPALAFLPSINNKPSKKLASGSLIIENKQRFIMGTLPGSGVSAHMNTPTTPATLPPKDEGYSTMSNGAIDDSSSSQQEQPSTSSSTATFTRPKKLGETRTSSNGNTGTWTKNKKLPSPASPSGRTFATATIQEPASITTTKDNVRIVHGLPTDIRFSCETCSSTWDDFSGGTVLLEDSDDSDILFLPIEVSSSGSESTLVPYPYSRSTRESDSEGTYYTAHGTTTGTEDSSDTTLSSTPTPTRKRGKEWNNNNNNTTKIDGGGGVESGWEEVDEVDLVQRWMRLEDMRNEEQEASQDNDDQLQLWSWDWDGIIRGNNCNSRGKRYHNKKESVLKSSPLSSVDSNTWTKSKRKSYLERVQAVPLSPAVSSQGADSSPLLPAKELDFTAEFYRLTTGTPMEDKLIQTEVEEEEEEVEEESDLFLQCKNCLEKMSKLISLQQQQEDHKARGESGCGGGVELMSITEQVAHLLKMNNSQGAVVGKLEKGEEGSSSKWLRVSPHQGDHHLHRLVSSTESEGLLSPSIE